MFKFIIILLISSKAFAQALPGMVGGEGTLKLGVNTASVSREEAAYYNPAGLSEVNSQISTGSTLVGISQNKNIEADRYFTAPSFVAIATPTSHGAYSFYFASNEIIKAGYDVDLSSEYNDLKNTKGFKYFQEMQIARDSIVFGMSFGRSLNQNWSWGYNLELNNRSMSWYQDKKVYRYDNSFNKTESDKMLMDYEVSSWMLQPGIGLQYQKPKSFGFGLTLKAPSLFLTGKGSASWSAQQVRLKNDNQVQIQDHEIQYETTKIMKNPLELRFGFYHFLNDTSYLEYGFRYTDIVYETSKDKNAEFDFLFYDQETPLYLNDTSFENSNSKEKTPVTKKIGISYTNMISDEKSFFLSIAHPLPDEDEPKEVRSKVYLLGGGFTQTINQNYKTTMGLTYFKSEAENKTGLKEAVLENESNMMSDYQALVLVIAGSYYY
jgi:hypothetical protein